MGCLVLLALGCWILWVRFNQSESPYALLLSDLVRYYVPMTNRAAERLAAGELPLWNEAACCGIPFLASLQTAVFYPPTWLALWIPAEELLPSLAFAQLVLAGVFAALLLRHWGCPWPAAALGALFYARSAALGQTLWPPAIATICWIPWLVLCADKVAREGSLRWWLGLVLGCALQILAGFPQLLLYGYGLVVPVALLALWQRRSRGAGLLARRLGALAAAGLLGAGLAGVQLLPTAELAALSPRAESLEPAEVHYLAPRALHASSDVLRSSLDPSPQSVVLHHETGYLGAALWSLVLSALVARRRQPLPWVLLAAAGLSLLLSDGYRGAASPLYALYAELPLLGSLRTPERLRLVTYLALAALAALGAASLLAAGAPRARRALTAACVLGSLPLLLAGLGEGSGSSAARAALALALCMAVLWPPARVARAAAFGLLVFSVWDLWAATRPTSRIRSIPPEVVRVYHFGGQRVAQQELDDFKRRVGQGRMELRYLPFVGAGPTGDVRRPSCYEPLVPEAWSVLHQRLLGRPSRGHTLAEPALAESAFYDVTSVRGLVRPGPDLGPAFDANENALPRAFFVARYRLAERSEVFDHIADADVDFHRAVFLDRDPGFPGGSAGLRPLTLRSARPERVEIAVDAAEPGLVVLTDSYYPGWEASVDGAPAEILRANGLHRAVAVPAGRHLVAFDYRPASLRAGVAVSLGAAGLLVAVCLASVARAARRRAD